MPRKNNTRSYPTPEGRMNQLTAKAYDLALKQLEEGTIAPSTLNVLLKNGTVEAELALENLRSKNKLTESKVSMIDSEVKGKGDSSAVIEALRGYSPSVHLD